jgi:hypothetical protein
MLATGVCRTAQQMRSDASRSAGLRRRGAVTDEVPAEAQAEAPATGRGAGREEEISDRAALRRGVPQRRVHQQQWRPCTRAAREQEGGKNLSCWSPAT